MSTFQKFAKINDRHFKVVRSRPKITPESELDQQEWEDNKDTSDFYSNESISQLADNDEIDSAEAGFMRGFLEA